MFQPVKKYEESLTQIKIGNKLPPNAVNLAFYRNKTETNQENSSVFVSSTERKTMDSTTGERWSLKKDLTEKNISEFPSNVYYKDAEGYIGTIKRKNILWETRNRGDKKNVTADKSYILTSKNAPKDIAYNDGTYSGTLYLKSAVYAEGTKSHTVKKKLPSTRKFFSRTEIQTGLTSNSATFPDSIDVTDAGFSGKLYKVEGKTRFVSKPIPTTFSYYDDLTGKVDGHFPSFMTKNGVTLYPTGEQEDRIVEKIIKHYGICRYWGGGSAASNNYYGNPNYRFSVGGFARGYFTDSLPKPTSYRYGHMMAELDKEDKYPVDTNGWYPLEKGIPWTYDIEEAMKYGGTSDPLRGGVVWASQYWTASGGVWPPPGYEDDYLAANGIEGHLPLSRINAGGITPINHQTYMLCTRASAQKTSTLGFYSSVTGWRNKWFRNTIHFYKGKTTETIAWAKYSGASILNKGLEFTAYQDYEGYLTKENTEDLKVIDEFLADCVYCGIVSKSTVHYDGRAAYEGIVYKKTSIADIEQELIPDNLYYTNKNHELCNVQTGYASIESDIVSMTNIFKDETPLHYMYKLKYPIYFPNGPKEEAITDVKHIKVLNSRMRPAKNQKYLLKLIPTLEENIYNVHLICSFPSRYNKPFYVVYDKYTETGSAEKEVVIDNLTRNAYSHLEKISTEPVCAFGKEYEVFYNNTTRKNIYKVHSSSIISDSRAKVNFSYVVKSVDGRYTSSILTATAVNRKYATESERVLFSGRKMIVSPVVNGVTLSAIDIMKNSYPGTSEELLGNLQYTLEVYDISASYKYKVNLYTDLDGYGPVMAETSEDTGFFDQKTGKFIGTLPKHYKYRVVGNAIHQLYHIKHIDQKEVSVIAPAETGTLECWYPRVQYTHFTSIDRQNSTRVQASYTMPEYDSQLFGNLGKPFMDIKKERTYFIDETHVKVRYAPLHITTNVLGDIPESLLKVVKVIGETEYPLTIKSWSSIDGILETNEKISSGDTILVDYVYIEETYRYKGYMSETNLISIDLNPNMYHSYIDNSEGAAIKNQTYDLFNKTIYFFLKPTKVENLDTLEVFETNPTLTLYHKIDDSKPDGNFDIMIGKVNLTPSSTLKNTEITDTRVLGGGLTEDITEERRKSLEPESDYYWDIAHWDGEPFAVNGVVLIRLDKKLLDRFTREEVEAKVQKHLAFGTLPLIEYITTEVNEEPLIPETQVLATATIIEE